MNMQSAITASEPLEEVALAPGPRPWVRVWLPLVMIGLAVIITRGIWLGNPVADIDEQLYSFIGWRMLHGELPYVDWWDRKPFGLFAIFAAAHGIGGPSALAYQVLAALATMAGGLLVYRLARALVDHVSASFAGVLYVALMAAYASYSAQSEIFHVPLILAMAVLVADQVHPKATRRAMVAMLLGGLALQVKYTVLPQCLFLGGWALWGVWQRAHDWRRFIACGASFAALGLLPTALVACLYAGIGEWDAFLFANVLSFFERAAAVAGRFDAGHMLFLMPVGVLLVLGAYAAVRMSPPKDLRRYGFYAGLFASALATAYLPATVYPYYFAALIPGAVLLATPLLNREGPFKLAPALMLTGLAFALLSLPERYQASRAMTQDIAQFAETAKPHVSAQDCLFVYDGPTVLYRLTGSCVPSRLVYPDHLNNALERGALGLDQAGEVERILATAPAAIVTADRALTPQNPQSTALVEQALAEHYREAASTDVHGRIHTLWVRK